MKLHILTIIQVLLLHQTGLANRHEYFKGEARENGQLVYIEKHDVTFADDNSVIEAKTTYVDPKGQLLGVLSSDFRQSLSLPEHVFQDERRRAPRRRHTNGVR